jgi:hypothetical protein
MNENDIALTVNRLRDIAKEYGQTQQLRERIAAVVVPLLSASKPAVAQEYVYETYTGQCGWLVVSKEEYENSEYRKRRAPLASSPTAQDDKTIIRELQKALFYWMPSIAGQDSPAGIKAAEHSYLLYGLDDNSTDCEGDRMMASIGIRNRALEQIEAVVQDLGCPENMDMAEFLMTLPAAPAQSGEPVAQYQTKLRNPILPSCDVWINVSEEGARTAREKYSHVYEVRELFERAAAPQPSQPVEAGEPIYQEWIGSAWVDVDDVQYAGAQMDKRRIVYAAPSAVVLDDERKGRAVLAIAAVIAAAQPDERAAPSEKGAAFEQWFSEHRDDDFGCGLSKRSAWIVWEGMWQARVAPTAEQAEGDAKAAELSKMLANIIHDQTVAMQSALIEWQHGKGAEAGFSWIVNTLEGPGHLPDFDAPYGKQAQFWFDANRAEPFPKCFCGNPSHQLWMGQGFCCNEHYAEAKAQHDAAPAASTSDLS